ncbi:MAG TPA: glycosyltransferase family 4 protein [Solirubrobacteraceae bacterium]|jgi:glycosyltransferase involved in cell wall biosynthesis|nr:glycosyltransferase family 4 protein [Solirubrobacteraceae bacterium]
MVLFLHNRYRAPGGEERVVDDLVWLVREHMGEPAELVARDSSGGERTRAAAGLLRGGLDPREVGDAVRRTGARVVHAHNIHPAFGWRALAAARAAGARVVVHLHQYRLVCAVGVCFTDGRECVRCHGRNTLPGVLRNCRGSRAEALVYGAGLALWQRRVVEQADAVIVPSEFARERLRELGAPLPWERVHVLAPPVRALEHGRLVAKHPPEGYALVVARYSPEKGIDVAIEACRRVGIPLVVAGASLDGGADVRETERDGVRFVGRVDDTRLAELRAGAALALVPSRSAETFGLAAAEAMAAGLPVAGSRVGALPELLEEEGMAPPGDAQALAEAIERVRRDPGAGERGLERVRALCAPEVIAGKLAEVYGTGVISTGGRARKRAYEPDAWR